MKWSTKLLVAAFLVAFAIGAIIAFDTPAVAGVVQNSVLEIQTKALRFLTQVQAQFGTANGGHAQISYETSPAPELLIASDAEIVTSSPLFTFTTAAQISGYNIGKYYGLRATPPASPQSGDSYVLGDDDNILEFAYAADDDATWHDPRSGLAPAAAPTFTTSSTFDYATASTAAVFDSNKNMVSSSTTKAEVDALHGKKPMNWRGAAASNPSNPVAGDAFFLTTTGSLGIAAAADDDASWHLFGGDDDVTP